MHQISLISTKCKKVLRSFNILNTLINIILLKASIRNFLRSPYKWLIYHNFKNYSNLLTYLSKFNALIDSDVNLVNCMNNEKVCIFKRVFRFHKDLPLELENIGTWSEDKKLLLNLSSERQQNLMRIVLNKCFVDTKHNYYRDEQIESINKMNFILFDYLSDMMNVTFKVTSQNSTGVYHEKTGWNGMIGNLIKQKCDIGGIFKRIWKILYYF